MTPSHVMLKLLESDSKYSNNLNLLKKIILTAFLGRLQINGLPPDNKISLSNYLFDGENILLDFTRVGDEKRKIFCQWLLAPHEKEKSKAYFRGTSVNEYRGFTAEVFLSLWGRIKNWLERNYSEYWQLSDLTVSVHYQLTGIYMRHSKNGILLGFDQVLVPASGTKYRDPNDLQKEPLGNTKRALITDRLVDLLIAFDPQKTSFESICNNPHPQSIEVTNIKARLEQMYEYRRTQRFLALKSWYIRMWPWLIHWFREDTATTNPPIANNQLKSLYRNETVHIQQYSSSHEILVTEKKPEIDSVVYCGGGAKIFGHVGFWKALNEANIHPTKFAGSSAGAIMALLCYLGYQAAEISALFKNFHKEHLIHFDINISGMSDTDSLKTALDFVVAYRLAQIVKKYNIPFPEGKITFGVIEAIRQQCAGSGLGKELVVTATNKKQGKTRYFSLQLSPDFELSEAVKVSASFPIFYRSTIIDDAEHSDGGILTNFPTEAFPEEYSTLLGTIDGHNLRVIAVQFDETERRVVDHIMDEVYRENFFVNWIYQFLTGVSDPASGWEQDRLKLRKYSSQTVMINTGAISSSSFSVGDKERAAMIAAGYQETVNYLTARYSKDKEGVYQNDEGMFAKFSSLADLLAYCCYRGDYPWFNKIKELIEQSAEPNKEELLKKAEQLKMLYFNIQKPSAPAPPSEDNPLTFFGNAIPQKPIAPVGSKNYKLLLAIYPLFLKLSAELLNDNNDKKLFEAARHSLTLHSPFVCLEHFSKIKGQMNVVLYSVIVLLKELKTNPRETIYEELKNVLNLLNRNVNIYHEACYGHWDLSLGQCVRVVRVLNAEQEAAAIPLLYSLQLEDESMQAIVDGVFYEDSESDDSSLCLI